LNPKITDIMVLQKSYNDNRQDEAVDETQRYTDYYMMGDQVQAQHSEAGVQ